jgi:phage-related protein
MAYGRFYSESTIANLPIMKQFAFINDAAEREYKDFPKEIQQQLGTSLRAVQDDKKPFLPIQTLEGIGSGVIELKINGSPAYRCVYTAKFLDTVFVLHSFEKTTNGVDRQAMKTVEKRYKELKAEIEKMKRQK